MEAEASTSVSPFCMKPFIDTRNKTWIKIRNIHPREKVNNEVNFDKMFAANVLNQSIIPFNAQFKYSGCEIQLLCFA